MAVQITKSDLTQKVQEGWKKDALAEHYGLPVAQMTKVLQQAGLTIRKFHRPKFELIDDTTTETPVTDINVEQAEIVEPQENAHEEPVTKPENVHEEIQHDVAAEVASIQEKSANADW